RRRHTRSYGDWSSDVCSSDLADQVGWRNIRDARTGVEFKPRAKWLVSGIYHNYWLASATDALYSTAGAVVARSVNGTAGTHVGRSEERRVGKSVGVGGGGMR